MAEKTAIRMDVPVVSCSREVFKDYKKNEERVYYRLYVICGNGRVGSISSSKPYEAGQVVSLTIDVRDNKLVPVILEPSSAS